LNDAENPYPVETPRPHDPGQFYSIGVVVDSNQMLGVVIDLNGEIVPLQDRSAHRRGEQSISEHLVSTDPNNVVTGITELVAELVAELRALRPGADNQFLGVGVAVGGHVNGPAGEVVLSPQLGWPKPVALAERLKRTTGLSTVMVENDVNALAVGAQFFSDATGSMSREGHHHSPMSFAVVALGTGIGAGLVLNAELYRGATGAAGEFGHFPTEKDGEQCICGKRGCLQTVAGGDAVLRAINGKRAANLKIKTIDEAADLVRKNDQAAHDAFEGAGEALGRGLAGLVNLLNLPLIILCGDPAMLACEPYMRQARRSFADRAFSTAASDCELRLERRTQQLEARGAASMVFESLVDHQFE
jgi:predicted NBD/HSP70 family sugar kinase